MMYHKHVLYLVLLVMATMVAGCRPQNSISEADIQSDTDVANIITPAATTVVSAEATTVTHSNKSQTFRIVPLESEARYQVQEQFLQLDVPTTTVGRTSAIEGYFQLSLEDGNLVLTDNQFTVDLRTLTSNDEERDSSIRERWLESNRYPFAEFTTTSVHDVPPDAPEGQEIPFTLSGEMTIRDITQPIEFDARAMFEDGIITGQATAILSMRDFGFEPPELFGFLRVEDEVTLTIDFTAHDTQASLDQAQTAPQSTITPTTDLVSDIPSDYRKRFFHYTTVNRPDGTFRQMYINPEALEAIRVDETLPNGTMIIMETYRNNRIGGTLFTREKQTGWGSDEVSEIAIEIRNGDWRYPSFAENDFRRLSADSTSCHACHIQAADRDYVFTMPDLIEAARTGSTQISECDRSGRQPCDP